MLLTIDIGNSSISCGVFAKTTREMLAYFKLAARQASAEEYYLLLHQFLSLYAIPHPFPGTQNAGLDSGAFLDDCVVSSVVPSLTPLLIGAAKMLTGKEPMQIAQGIRTGFGIQLHNPEQVGADIISNIAAAFAYEEPPFVVLDVGTATTISFVTAERILTGIAILPGLSVSMEALFQSAALLNEVSLERPTQWLGKNTSESVRSGVINGHIFAVDGFVRNIREQYLAKEQKLGLCATGGLARYILPYCRNRFTYHKDLTLEGEMRLWLLNHTK